MVNISLASWLAEYGLSHQIIISDASDNIHASDNRPLFAASFWRGNFVVDDQPSTVRPPHRPASQSLFSRFPHEIKRCGLSASDAHTVGAGMCACTRDKEGGREGGGRGYGGVYVFRPISRAHRAGALIIAATVI